MSSVIIGANFGDEGKGLITDFEARRTGATLVARYNGGAQAGHTVVTPDGRRHVFGHFGAGTFAGCKTYLSKNFIVSPIAFELETNSFSSVYPDVPIQMIVHPECRVTTVFDIILNTLAESARGGAKHGSCGYGVNETVTRHDAGFRFTAEDLAGATFPIVPFLTSVRDEYFPRRVKELGIESFVNTLLTTNDFSNQAGLTAIKSILSDRNFLMHAMKLIVAADRMLVSTGTCKATDEVVFEGAQGLALDEELGEFPNVTRSRTGLISAIEAAEELGVQTLTPIYVTRVYLTRHGAGKLAHENEFICKNTLVDATNVTNAYQGEFRYAPLNLPQLKDFIMRDLARAKAKQTGVEIRPAQIAVTCIDQVGDEVHMIGLSGASITVQSKDAAQFIADSIGLTLSHVSTGPSAANVSYVL